MCIGYVIKFILRHKEYLCPYFLPLQVVVCGHTGCGSRIQHAFGHGVCRTHAPCLNTERESVTFWSPNKCSVCFAAWKAVELNNEYSAPYKTQLRQWVQGFQTSRNYNGPYLPCESVRQMLFPTAGLDKVVSPPLEVSFQTFEGNYVLASDDEDQVSLESGQIPFPLSSQAPRLTGRMMEQMKVTPVPPKLKKHRSSTVPGTSFCVDAGEEMDTMEPELPKVPLVSIPQPASNELLLELLCEVKSLKEAKASCSSLPPLDSAPPEEAGNPWRSCLYTAKADGSLFVAEGQSFKLSKLEFFPSLEVFPKCYFRFITGMLGSDKVPAETVILSTADAMKYLSTWSKDVLGGQKATKGCLGLSDPIFLAPGSFSPPFFGKILKAVEKQFLDDPKDSFSSLKEIKPFGMICPSESKTFPEFKELSAIFETGKLDQGIATKQFNEELPQIASDIITAEFNARKVLARSFSTQCILERQMLVDPSASWVSVAAKLHCETVGRDLLAFMKAKSACRNAVLGRNKGSAEVRELLRSSHFCPKLFPEELVTKLRAAANRTNESLMLRWKLAPKGTSSGGKRSHSSSSSDLGRGRSKNRRRSKGSGGRGGQQPFRSPVENPKFEADSSLGQYP